MLKRLRQSVSFKTIIYRLPPRVKMRPPDWQWEQMRRRGSGRGSFGDGADVNHFHHWFTRTQHALSADAPTPFIYPYSSTFSFCCIKTLSHTRTLSTEACAQQRVHTGIFPSGIIFCRWKHNRQRPQGASYKMHGVEKNAHKWQDILWTCIKEWQHIK